MYHVVWLLIAGSVATGFAGDTAQKQQEAQKQQNGQQQQSNGKQWDGQMVQSPPSQARGNWYIKRRYVREARDVYEQHIRPALDQMEQLQDQFMSQRKTILDTIWKFYQEYAIDIGQLLQRIRSIVKQLEQQKDNQDDLSQEEQEWLQKAQGYKATLQEMDEHVTSLQELHNNLDKSITLFDEQVDQVDTYEQKAWDLYKQIIDAVSDQVAEQHFRELKGIRNNADQIVTWATNEFAPFLDKAGKQIESYISKLKSALDTVEKGGVTLRENLQKQEKESEQDAQQKQQQEQQEKPSKQTADEQPGFMTQAWQSVVDTVAYVGDIIVAGWNTVLSYIGLA